jgi:SAM-dependent methyltransferase
MMSTADQDRAPQHAEHTSSDQGGGTTFDRDASSNGRSEATPQKSIGDSEFDKAYSSGRPPWDIGQPQPAFVALAQAGRITGKVLDVGCGTGENAPFLCQRGLDVLGLDLSSVAIAEARTKAQARGVVARFMVGSALDLLGLEEIFDTVIDSGLLHILSDADRARVVAGLHAVLRPAGYLHLLAFNEHATWPGPGRLTQPEIRTAFEHGWEVEALAAPASKWSTAVEAPKRGWPQFAACRRSCRIDRGPSTRTRQRNTIAHCGHTSAPSTSSSHVAPQCQAGGSVPAGLMGRARSWSEKRSSVCSA